MSTVLLLTGGLFQIFGVLMVVFSLRRTLAELAKYESRGNVVFGVLTLPAIGSFTAGNVSVDPPPPLEARVRALEDRVGQFPAEVQDAGTAGRDQMRREVQGQLETVVASYKRDFGALSKLTTDSLRGSSWPTYIGVVLLV